MTLDPRPSALDFSIITPSFNQLDWLRLCVASVRDQVLEGSSDESRETSAATRPSTLDAAPRLSPTLCVEHIIQDAGTPDIEEFAREVGADFYRDGVLVFSSSHPPLATRHPPPCPRHYRIAIFSESDDGMYDAINRGLARATGNLCAYLNCDEQYLPGSLCQVTALFAGRPSLDLLFGDAVLADETGPVSYRHMILPRRRHLEKRSLNTLTCATFFRRALIDRGFLFDPQWKIVGDKAWVHHLIKSGITMDIIPQPLSVYFFTGQNLSENPNGLRERAAWMKQNPALPLYPARLIFSLRKLMVGAYTSRKVTISIFTPTSPTERVSMTNPQTRHHWPKPKSPEEHRTS